MLRHRDYLRKNGFTDAVIGLSGGVDSSLVAAVAVDALGADHVHGLSMPSRYSSAGSITDAEALARNLGIDSVNVPIEGAHAAFTSVLAARPRRGACGPDRREPPVADPWRGAHGGVQRPGLDRPDHRQQERARYGYSTLYGDSAGGFAVIKDVPKTLVYRLCRYRNARQAAELIPETVSPRRPRPSCVPTSATTRALPPYEVLDPLLEALVLHDRSIADVVEQRVRPRARRPGGVAGRRRRVQAPAVAARCPHHRQGIRQGSAHADHQSLPRPAPRHRSEQAMAASGMPDRFDAAALAMGGGTLDGVGPPGAAALSLLDAHARLVRVVPVGRASALRDTRVVGGVRAGAAKPRCFSIPIVSNTPGMRPCSLTGFLRSIPSTRPP